MSDKKQPPQPPKQPQPQKQWPAKTNDGNKSGPRRDNNPPKKGK